MMGSKRVSAIDRTKQDNLFNPTVAKEAMQGQIEINNKIERPANNEISKQVNNQTSNNINNETSNNVNNEASNNDNFKRQTYYLSKNLIQAIALKAAYESKDKSEIVRAALEAFIEDKYFNFKID